MISAIVFVFVSWCLISIIVHRIILLGGESAREKIIFWTRRETWFAGYLIVISILMAPLFLLRLIPHAGDFISWFAVAYLASRIALVLPGIAVGRAVSLGLSWRLTRRYQIPAFLIIGVLPWALSFPLSFLSGIWYLVPVRLVAELLIALYTIAAISVFYREVVALEYAVKPDDEGLEAST